MGQKSPTDIEVQYETKLNLYVLTRISRTQFASVLDLGCGVKGRVLRSVVQKVGAERAKGIV